MGIAGQARFQLVQLGEIDRLLFVDDLQFGLRIGVAEEDVGIAGSDTGLVQRLAGHVEGRQAFVLDFVGAFDGAAQAIDPEHGHPHEDQHHHQQTGEPQAQLHADFHV
jgi:hypothetical protein